MYWEYENMMKFDFITLEVEFVNNHDTRGMDENIFDVSVLFGVQCVLILVIIGLGFNFLVFDELV